MLVQVTCQWTNHHSITRVKHRCKELLQSFYSDLSLRIKGSPCSFIKLHVVSGSWLRRLQPVFVLCHVEDIDQELAAKMGASPPLPKLPQGIEARKEKLLHSSDAKNLAKTCDFQQLGTSGHIVSRKTVFMVQDSLWVHRGFVGAHLPLVPCARGLQLPLPSMSPPAPSAFGAC